jgi:hypothetical protein
MSMFRSGLVAIALLTPTLVFATEAITSDEPIDLT